MRNEQAKHTAARLIARTDEEDGVFVTEEHGAIIATVGGPADSRLEKAMLFSAAPNLLDFVEKVRDFARERCDEALYAEADDLIATVEGWS
jgi:hypothetical protein